MLVASIELSTLQVLTNEILVNIEKNEAYAYLFLISSFQPWNLLL